MPRKMSDPSTIPEKIMKSGAMPEKMRKSGQALEKGLGKHRKRLDPGEYRKRLILASVEKV